MEIGSRLEGPLSRIWLCVETHQGFATVYAERTMLLEVRYCYNRTLPWAIAHRDRTFLKRKGEKVAFRTPQDAAMWIERACLIVPFTARDAA